METIVNHTNEPPVKQALPALPKAHIGHISLPAQNPNALADFYQELFGMHVVGGAANGAFAFLASEPSEESHDIAFSRDSALAHIAFEVDTLADLVAGYQTLRARGIPVVQQFHGVSLAVYFRDPEQNLIEFYWSTNRTDFWLPVIRPLDLDQSEAELLHMIEALPSNIKE